MGLRINFLSGRKIPFSYAEKQSFLTKWRQYYRIPFCLCLQIIEVISASIYLFSVLVPVQSEAQILRNVFKDIFFLEKHEAPVSRASDLNDYYQFLETAAENVRDDFIIKTKFPNETNLVYHTITFSNGSQTLEFHPKVDPESLKNISTIRSSVPIYLFSTRKPALGCSNWELVITVSDIQSNPAFFLSSKLYWHHCPLDDDGTVLGEQIDRSELPYYRKTMDAIVPLILSSFIHLFYILYQARSRLKLHWHWRKTDGVYQELKSNQQFYYTIGFWIPCEFVSSISLIISSFILYNDSRKMTEYPSLLVMQIFTVSTTFLFLTTLQWFKFNVYTYHFVAILREGSVQLFAVAISFLPVICAFFFAGIFIFANIAPKTRSYFSMLTILVSFTLGDNILPVYDDFSDGTFLFNWVAFIYVTLLVLVAGWVVFSSFTAMISLVDQKLLMKKKRHTD
ncbi:hypothetical protein TRFO_28704 [Tritrichomonas foetus]|uniref:Polycystin cation channel PKD1/PKD2 domain-containing protein n=1 Tax=Tritrichomonas foetus TaxID=1144522 RepID=A0A1J4K2G4_9EUKA|nr:hypothetical protein TRFO_28704 [Tritrichomonas foetus]|eukprot:OHT03926.1 hypothetical protein TRFO_28704 [Tritrichomonas foetus]